MSNSKKQLEKVTKNIKLAVSTQLVKVCLYEERLVLITAERVGGWAKRQTNRENQRKPQAWWDKEVELDIKELQKASKAHGKITNEDRLEEEVDRKWKTYKEARQKAFGLLQAKSRK